MLTYSPGTWHALVTPTGVALLAPDVPFDAVETMWRALPRSSGGLAVVLEGLVGTFGTSLSSLPSFAVVTPDDADGIRVIVRGPVQATATTIDGSIERVSGLGVTTWSETVIASPAFVELSAPGGSGASFPIRDGIVLADSLRWRLRGDAVVTTLDSDGLSAAVLAPIESSPPPAPVGVVPDAPEQAALVLEPEPAEPVLAAVVAPEPAASETILPASEATVDVVPDEATLHDSPVGELLEDTTGYDDLVFGETRMSSVEEAAVREAEESDGMIVGLPDRATAAGSPVSAPLAGDHDGETVTMEQLAVLQQRLGSQQTPPAVRPAQTSAPVLVVSSGERVILDKGAVVGRRPGAVRATPILPHLVAVASPQQDISRNHVELRVDGRDVVAIDLNTTNGTLLLRVGSDPVRLQPHESTLLVTGDRLDLGDGIVLSFEGLT